MRVGVIGLKESGFGRGLAHIGELYVVGVDVLGGRLPAVEEELLPHDDHLLAEVVHDGDLDRELVLHDGA